MFKYIIKSEKHTQHIASKNVTTYKGSFSKGIIKNKIPFPKGFHSMTTVVYKENNQLTLPNKY